MPAPAATVIQVTMTPDRTATLNAILQAISDIEATGDMFIGVTPLSDNVVSINGVDSGALPATSVTAILIDNTDLQTTGGVALQTQLAAAEGGVNRELHDLIKSPYGYYVGIIERESESSGAGIDNAIFLFTGIITDRELAFSTPVVPPFPDPYASGPPFNIGEITSVAGGKSLIHQFVDLTTLTGVTTSQNGYEVTLLLNPSGGWPGPLVLPENVNIRVWEMGYPTNNLASINFTVPVVQGGTNAIVIATTSFNFWVQNETFDIEIEYATATVGSFITLSPVLQVNGYLSA